MKRENYLTARLGFGRLFSDLRSYQFCLRELAFTFHPHHMICAIVPRGFEAFALGAYATPFLSLCCGHTRLYKKRVGK